MSLAEYRMVEYCNVSIIGSHHVTCDKVPGKIIVSSEVPSGCDM